jgi:hypothetical protein
MKHTHNTEAMIAAFIARTAAYGISRGQAGAKLQRLGESSKTRQPKVKKQTTQVLRMRAGNGAASSWSG